MSLTRRGRALATIAWIALSVAAGFLWPFVILPR
jgi:hypothetical protein